MEFIYHSNIQLPVEPHQIDGKFIDPVIISALIKRGCETEELYTNGVFLYAYMKDTTHSYCRVGIN